MTKEQTQHEHIIALLENLSTLLATTAANTPEVREKLVQTVRDHNKALREQFTWRPTPPGKKT